MSDRHFHTIIIGAGPAGMGAAIPLVKSGADVCVIDKAVFPRDKTCAGLVTAKTYRLIRSLLGADLPDDLFCFTTDSVRLFDRTSLLTQATLEQPVPLPLRQRSG